MISDEQFSARLFEVMKQICPAVEGLELYEFRYGLHNLRPEDGWGSVEPEACESILARVESRVFYDGIRIKPKRGEQIVLDDPIVELARTLFAGLVSGAYDPAWVTQHFFFDLRGFLFLHRTLYFTEEVLAHFGGRPWRQFEQKQKAFESVQDVGYKAFKEANAEVDALFIDTVRRLIGLRGTPAILAIAGPTAAGKTEIVERLHQAFAEEGRQTTSLELDNFLTDREPRERKGIFTQGREAMHFDLFLESLRALTRGEEALIPRYDFVHATSSHDQNGRLKPEGAPIRIQPADIIFIEGNFPFLYEEAAALIHIKAVYLTDDPVRLKRKWKRDIDYRKKYEPTYFRNRYFKDQFIMAGIAYRPQLAVCDLAVDTTGGALWAAPETVRLVEGQGDGS